MSLYERMTVDGSTLLMDGEVGGGLRKRLPDESDKSLVPAWVLFDHASVVRDLHRDYIAAGAQVITTNTYATVKRRMEKLLGAGDRWEEAVRTACKMAQQARAESGKDVLIAGSLPPLHGSYRPELVGAQDDILPVYRQHVALMAEYVDLFLCETMSTAQEALAAVTAAKESGKPVWVSWNLQDEGTQGLRNGETLQQAWDAIAALKPEAALVNCCSPETVTAVMPAMAALGVGLFGGYGNGFVSIPTGWTNQGAGINALGKRLDLTPDAYADMALRWRESGARIIGGCCEVGADHIAVLRRRLDQLAAAPAGPASKKARTSEEEEEAAPSA